MKASNPARPSTCGSVLEPVTRFSAVSSDLILDPTHDHRVLGPGRMIARAPIRRKPRARNPRRCDRAASARMDRPFEIAATDSMALGPFRCPGYIEKAPVFYWSFRGK